MCIRDSLDPELDLWKTAQPFLERWMSEQIGWRSVLKRIKTEAPHWGAVLPTLPRKIDAFLTHDINQTAELTLEVSRLKVLHEKQRRLIYALIALVFIVSVISIEFR